MENAFPTQKRILVLGVGNILLRDEGVGVRVVERLEERYSFSSNVEVMDGGTLGLKLMDAMISCTYLIVVDAVLNGGSPGSIYRLTGDQIGKSLAFKNSLHQTDLIETLVCCELVGHRPETVVVGIEPKNYSPWSDKLTATIRKRLETIEKTVLREIERAGGEYALKKTASHDQATP